MLSRRKQAFVGLVVAAALGTGLGCGSGGTSPVGPVSATGSVVLGTQSFGVLDGVWRGKSAQGRPISFTVWNQQVVSLSVEWRGQGAVVSCDQTSEHSLNVAILPGEDSSLGTFRHTEDDLPVFEGVFNSSGTASGTFLESLALPGGTCSSGNVAWTASK